IAGAQTGAAINVHIDPAGACGLEVIDVLVDEGFDPTRLVLSHMDEHMDYAYHLAVAETGAAVEYDTFGSEFYWGRLEREPTDLERFAGVRHLLDAGHRDRIVLGCDIWLKMGLRRYGGMGYDHLLRRVVPALRNAYDVTQDEIAAMLVDTPRRILDRP
ncbi:MAG: phosphotriesterase, partial [Solirubrobacterales bacterium]|nr:phosphotriesterase [Solirubrobacterales bacterium]